MKERRAGLKRAKIAVEYGEMNEWACEIMEKRGTEKYEKKSEERAYENCKLNAADKDIRYPEK